MRPRWIAVILVVALVAMLALVALSRPQKQGPGVPEPPSAAGRSSTLSAPA